MVPEADFTEQEVQKALAVTQKLLNSLSNEAIRSNFQFKAFCDNNKEAIDLYKRSILDKTFSEPKE
jgi:hypothetical protein